MLQIGQINLHAVGNSGGQNPTILLLVWVFVVRTKPEQNYIIFLLYMYYSIICHVSFIVKLSWCLATAFMLILFHFNKFTFYLVDDKSDLLNLAEGQEAIPRRLPLYWHTDTLTNMVCDLFIRSYFTVTCKTYDTRSSIKVSNFYFAS